MLLLGRRIDEDIVVRTPDGSRIDVTVADIPSRNQVRLGFMAAAHVQIKREELSWHPQGRVPSQDGEVGCLYLARRVGEAVLLWVGEEVITVRVSDMPSRGQVRLGIEAREAVQVLRAELDSDA